MTTPLSPDLVRAQLRTVADPELDIDIVTLGLIRDIRVDSVGGIDVVMTLTSPFCPFGEEIVASVEKALAPLHSEVRVDLSFDPEWDPPSEVRDLLGIPE